MCETNVKEGKSHRTFNIFSFSIPNFIQWRLIIILVLTLITLKNNRFL